MSNILREIGVISRSLAFISNVEFKQINLNKDQYLYLTRIYENPGIINDALAEMIKQERTTTAKSIRKLEEQGLICKKVDSENKKIRRLFTTEKADSLYDYLCREEQYSEEQALKGLSEEEQQQLLLLLQKVSKNVESDWTQVKNGYKRTY